ncbi:MAG: VWA domain-containing protein [Magnetococcales bacterium]|nr:VWA domain-containing protein [Magnetococcales bacterium]
MLDWLAPGLEFRDPLALWAALLAPVVFRMVSHPPGSITTSSLQRLAAVPQGGRVRWVWLPGGLLALAVVALAIALAGPRTGDATSEVHREGIAILLAIDRSGSMDARDFVAGDLSVSRLDALKKVIGHFIRGDNGFGSGRRDDLIGIVAFGTFADSVSPLTLDHANLLAILDQLQVARQPSEANTAIGEGLGLAVERLRLLDEEHQKKKVRSKVIILLSDGANNAGDVEPMQAAELAASHNIQVYAIAAGSTGYAPIPVPTPDGRVQLMRQYLEVDETTLSAIAKRTGGRFYHAGNMEELQHIYHEIDQLEKSEISEVRYVQYREHYAVWVLAAMTLMVTAALLHATWLRRLP